MTPKGRSRSRWGIWVFIWWVLCLAAAVVVALPLIYQVRYVDRVYEGVYASGTSLGGMTLDDATNVLRSELRLPSADVPVILRDGTHEWTLTTAELGLSIDARATAAEAFSVGRHGQMAGLSLAALQIDLTEQWQAWRYGISIGGPTLKLDENRLAIVLKQIAREVDQPPQEGTLNLDGPQVTGTPGATGRVVDVDATRAALFELLRSGQGGEVALVVVTRQPVVTSVEAAVSQANALLSRSLNLVAEGVDGAQRTSVERAMLRTWLRFSPAPGSDGAIGLTVQVEAAKIQAHVQALAKQFDKPAHDAALDYDVAAKQVVVVKPSLTGQAMDVKGSVDAISRTLISLASNPAGSGGSAAAANDPVAITLPTKIILPKVDSTRVADLGIKELVTQGTTYFAGSTRERVHNIVNATQKFNAAIVPPGEEFSFNKIVGDVSAENGFVDSLIISGDRTELGIGGGVCQVSTTAFRAAVQGGFPIVERHTHSYVVSWYGEPGLDATIFTPYVDFRFKNDTGAFLLVKPEVDTAKGRITFSFYGTRPNRTVELSRPEITNIQKPEPPIYQEDSTLPRGTIKQVDWAKDGQDVVVKRTIRNGDGKVVEDRFVSKYEAWRSVFLYGPGAKLPADAIILPVTPSPTPKPTATPAPRATAKP